MKNGYCLAHCNAINHILLLQFYVKLQQCLYSNVMTNSNGLFEDFKGLKKNETVIVNFEFIAIEYISIFI